MYWLLLRQRFYLAENLPVQRSNLAYCGELLMVFSTKKRFIAGVVCPKCSEMDKIRAFNKDGVDYRECVSCGFLDRIRIASEPKELTTRVTKSDSEPSRRVRLVDPSKPKP